MQKSADAFRTISEVADDLSSPARVAILETRFPQIRPLKRAGGRRYYRPNDVLLLRSIRQLLYDDGYTIKGVQRLLKEQGARGLGLAVVPTAEAAAIVGGGHEEAEPGAPTMDRTELLEEATRLLMSADYTRLSDAHREAIETALETVEECKRILDVARRSG